jgi:2-polyprenyl-6-methoxyphenol hydroxylase-like FAD-dependent oxidoreductase
MAKRITVVGGGPAGLYFSYLWKSRHPGDAVTLFEQNPANATFGFGVVFSDRALEFLSNDDPETYRLVASHTETWHDLVVVHCGERVAIDGIGFSAIGRLELLQLLQAQARAAGVVMKFGRTFDPRRDGDGCDLVVAADGVNSAVRRAFADQFGASQTQLRNKFIWYGVAKPFDTLTQTFVRNAYGTFNAHHYRYSPSMSTFIVECDPATWERAGFADKTADEGRRMCEEAFAEAIDGHQLISNNSMWRQFPMVRVERWSYRNIVLLGDALHTVHFSVGSGTRCAIEDAIALARALDAEPDDVRAGLARYEAARRPVAQKLIDAAATSAQWYEHFPEHMKLAPPDFALSYITRSGRIDKERLRRTAPNFVARYEAGIGPATWP